MPDPSLADRLFDAVVRDLADSTPVRPRSTYRIQLHQGFSLSQARTIIGYLDDLGVGDLYLSPFLAARPGSMHGYDVFDHSRINPEVGGESEHAKFAADLRARGMGRVLDIVPNHMGVNGRNPYWLDVLEIGPQSPFAAFFDIDWHPVKDELEGRVLLPVLEDRYGVVLEAGKMRVHREDGALVLKYGHFSLPLAPKSYAIVLAEAARAATDRFEQDDPHVLELFSIWASAEAMPDRASGRLEDVSHTLREQKILPRRIARLCEDSADMRAVIDAAVDSFQGQPGQPSTFNALHQLLEAQVYRLSSWKVAAQEINYRRFFDVNELAGLRTEDARVYEAIHTKVFDWINEGGVAALRIDHPDGLADPASYFRRLQESIFLLRCRQRFAADGLPEDQWFETSIALRKRHRLESVSTESPLRRSFSIVIEKILSRGEELPDDWPIDGTVGYEFLNVLNGLFIDPSANDVINAIYGDFTGDREPFPDVLYRSKKLIGQVSLASEINALSRQLNRVAEQNRGSRDFTLNDLQVAIREVIACFPVYRTYLEPGCPASARDLEIIENAVDWARRKAPSVDPTVFDFLKSTLLLEPIDGLSTQGHALREVFVRRFQQTTGPVQAKGLEDTAFYRQVPLVSRNEVGADPSRFASSPVLFHALNSRRLEAWPGSLGTTATHDTKRGEDARARIDAISELPEEWRGVLGRAGRCNAVHKTEVRGLNAPDSREEYLFYQTLIGSWVPEAAEAPPCQEFVTRIRDYMLKAIREAKVNTSWNDPDPSYSDAVARFVENSLRGPGCDVFLREFLPFQDRIARIGVVNSLAQTILKLASPGVPDVYQGCEYWDLSLVDPDNRRPVDYEARIRSLRSIDDRLRAGANRADLARELLANWRDAQIKQYVIATTLRHRRENYDVYAKGGYHPLDALGEAKMRVVAFARIHNGQTMITAAARLVSGWMGPDGSTMPVGSTVWSDLVLDLGTSGTSRRWRDILTDRTIEVRKSDGLATLPLGEVFGTLPIALLVAV